jgi:tRNA pseudouridine32 synthase/23S rRNA pseudouridine746 synthase
MSVTTLALLPGGSDGLTGRHCLRPQTGKTHQLRLHMAEIGFPILHDPHYPVLQAEGERDWERPMQLLAAALAFDDPVTGERRELRSRRRLAFDG